MIEHIWATYEGGRSGQQIWLAHEASASHTTLQTLDQITCASYKKTITRCSMQPVQKHGHATLFASESQTSEEIERELLGLKLIPSRHKEASEAFRSSPTTASESFPHPGTPNQLAPSNNNN